MIRPVNHAPCSLCAVPRPPSPPSPPLDAAPPGPNLASASASASAFACHVPSSYFPLHVARSPSPPWRRGSVIDRPPKNYLTRYRDPKIVAHDTDERRGREQIISALRNRVNAGQGAPSSLGSSGALELSRPIHQKCDDDASGAITCPHFVSTAVRIMDQGSRRETRTALKG
ncbi:unnamed protein product [Cutaneotrichosporon oleaginosum]